MLDWYQENNRYKKPTGFPDKYNMGMQNFCCVFKIQRATKFRKEKI